MYMFQRLSRELSQKVLWRKHGRLQAAGDQFNEHKSLGGWKWWVVNGGSQMCEAFTS